MDEKEKRQFLKEEQEREDAKRQEEADALATARGAKDVDARASVSNVGFTPNVKDVKAMFEQNIKANQDK